jgi:hypothetical protein
LNLAKETQGWEIVSQNSELTVRRKTVPTTAGSEGAIIIRGEAVVDVPALAFQDALQAIEIKHQWDPMVVSAKHLEVVDDYTVVSYDDYKAVWPTMARDMCYSSLFSGSFFPTAPISRV